MGHTSVSFRGGVIVTQAAGRYSGCGPVTLAGSGGIRGDDPEGAGAAAVGEGAAAEAVGVAARRGRVRALTLIGSHSP